MEDTVTYRPNYAEIDQVVTTFRSKDLEVREEIGHDNLDSLSKLFLFEREKPKLERKNPTPVGGILSRSTVIGRPKELTEEELRETFNKYKN